jgi:biopolymer transport protein ExbB/TolQ
LALTFGFYALLPSIDRYLPDADRYFTAHWIEYVACGLFFIGLATLGAKAWRLPAEWQALSAGLLDGLETQPEAGPVDTVQRLTAHLRLVARRSRETYLVRRLEDICEYVRGRRSADGLEGHLSYLAETASGRQHDGYALIRTITWAIPILGFLGTVIGITLSIANITPDQLESSLGEVTAGLAVAFDTTALSLALSMVLVFVTFVVERQEQGVLDAVEDFAMQKLVGLFPANDARPAESPLLAAQQTAADLLLKKTETLIGWQMSAWQSSLDELRDRWSGTLHRQQASLDQALQAGLTDALADHAQQLAAVRGEFLTAFERAASTLAEQVAQTTTALEQQQQFGVIRMQETWSTLRSEWAAASQQQAEQLGELTVAVSGEVRTWQDQLRTATAAMTDQLAELREQGSVLLRIVEQEEQLVRLEDRLAQNLEAVRVVESLEETLLNLNAAIHLLSTKTRAKAA